MSRPRVKNAFVAAFLVYNNTTCVICCQKGDKIFLPGGRPRAGERPFAGMRRKFREETGIELPRLGAPDGKDDVYSITYHGHSKIYAGPVVSSIGDPAELDGSFVRSLEVDRVVLMDIRVLLGQPGVWKERYMHESFLEVFEGVIKPYFGDFPNVADAYAASYMRSLEKQIDRIETYLRKLEL